MFLFKSLNTLTQFKNKFELLCKFMIENDPPKMTDFHSLFFFACLLTGFALLVYIHLTMQK